MKAKRTKGKGPFRQTNGFVMKSAGMCLSRVELKCKVAADSGQLVVEEEKKKKKKNRTEKF